jgi:hypothetical protein
MDVQQVGFWGYGPDQAKSSGSVKFRIKTH